MTVGQRYEVAFDMSGNPVGGPLLKQLRVTVDDFSHDYVHDSSGQLKKTSSGMLSRFRLSPQARPRRCRS